MPKRSCPVLRGGCFALLLIATQGILPAVAQSFNSPIHSIVWNMERSQRFQFRLVAGRIRTTWQRTDGNTHHGNFGQYSVKEELTVHSSPPQGHYDYTSPEIHMVVDFADLKLSLHVSPQGKSSQEEVELVQPATGPLVVKIGSGERLRTVEASSLWHLLLFEPEAGRKILPWLEALQIPSASADLSKMLHDARALLLRNAVRSKPFDQSRLVVLVAQLGDSQYAQREAADGELRSMGAAVIEHLQRIDPRQLDLEQQCHVRRILATFTNRTGDSPEWIAAWFLEDAEVWLVLLAQSDESVRRLAVNRLQAILHRPITIDPAGDKALRTQQIEALRAELRTPPAKEK